MKLRVLGAYGAEAPGGKHPTAFLVNERTLIDAGGVTSILSIPEQMAIEHVLVSHSHLDHIAGLGYLTEARALCGADRPLMLCSIEPVVQSLHRGLFNNAIWPDFTAIPSVEKPVIKFRVLAEQTEEEVGDLRVTAVPVNHTVPAAGYIVRDEHDAVVYSADTGPTELLWQVARTHSEVRAVILECSYPNRLGFLAEQAKHLTPSLVERELEKLPPGIAVLIFHIKPLFYEEIADELHRIKSSRIVLPEQGKTYEFQRAGASR
jgi:ribonuclease BN (tRNA processing enzyme)